MANKVQATMSTEIALDMLQASNSIKSITQLVNSATKSWKAQEAQLKSTGDYLGAAKAKYEGLSDAIEAQKSKIEALKDKQSGLKGDTEETARAYAKYQSQIDSATSKLASMEAQQDRAKSAMELQQSGILQLNNSIKAQTSLMEATIKKQEALGDARAASNTKIESLTSINSKYEDVLEKEKEQLEKVKDASGNTSDAYTKQATRVENLKAKIAENNSAINSERENLEKSAPSGFFSSLKEKLVGTNDEINKSEGLMHKATSFFVGGVLVNGFQNATSAVKEFAEQGFESAEAAQEVAEKWKNMGASEADITTMGNSVKSLKENTNMSGTAVANLTTKFYDMTGSAKQTAQLTEGIGSLSDKLKLSSSQANNFSSSIYKVYSNGSLTQSTLSRLEKQAPGLGTALQQASGMSKTAFDSAVSAGKISSDQFSTILQKASKDYKKNSSEFDESSQGALKHIKQSWADTKQALMTPLVNIAATGLSSLSTALEAPAMQNAIKQLGTGIANLGTKLTGVMKYVAAHESDIQSIISSVVQITKLIAIGVWDTFKGAITGISNAFNDMSGNANKTKDPLKSVASFLKAVAGQKKLIEDVGKVLAVAFASKAVLSGIHSMATGVRALYKDFNTLKNGITMIKNVMSSASIGTIWLVAIAAIIAAFVELYKHNAKFRDFVNGLVKSSQRFATDVVKWFGKAWSAVKTGISDTINFIKKNWAGLALLLVNPIAGGLVLLYNNNPKFRKWANDLWSGIKNAFTAGWTAIKDACLAGVSWIEKKWNELKTGVVNIANALWNTVKSIWSAYYQWTINIDTTIKNSIVNVWNAIKSLVINIVNGLWNGVKTVFTTLKNWSIDIFNGLKTGVVDIWNGIKKSISDVVNGIWSGVKTVFTTMYDWLNKETGGRLGDVLNTFSSIFTNIQKVVSGAVKGVHTAFVDIVRGIAKPFNDLLSGLEKGINWVLDKVGASKIKGTWSIPLPAYASGTGGVLKDQLAMVNDGKGSNYQEMYRTPSGEVGMFPAVRNMIVPLKAGTEILDGERSAQLSSMMQISHYASGTVSSFFGSIWNKGKDLLEDADKIIAHPAQFLESVFTKFTSSISSGAGLASDIITNLPSTIAKSAVNWIKSLFSDDAGGSSANPSGSGVQRWKDDVIKALKANGLSTSSDMVAKVLRQIATESSGNPNARQAGSDPDGDGSGPALGLMQTKRSTFNAYKFSGHSDIFNGYDNLLAALKYAKARYGSSLSYLGNGHGYENGGIVSQHGMYEVAEHNNPEAIIPLASIKQAAATQVLDKVATKIANETTVSNLDSSSDKDYKEKLDELSSKFDSLISLMKQQISATKAGAFDKTKFYQQTAVDQQLANYQALNN